MVRLRLHFSWLNIPKSMRCQRSLLTDQIQKNHRLTAKAFRSGEVFHSLLIGLKKQKLPIKEPSIAQFRPSAKDWKYFTRSGRREFSSACPENNLAASGQKSAKNKIKIYALSMARVMRRHVFDGTLFRRRKPTENIWLKRTKKQHKDTRLTWKPSPQ